MDKDFVLDQYVVLMAEMLAIPLTEVERPSVVLQMRLSADLPMQVMEFDVPQELEPAPVFKALKPRACQPSWCRCWSRNKPCQLDCRSSPRPGGRPTRFGPPSDWKVWRSPNSPYRGLSKPGGERSRLPSSRFWECSL